MYEVKQYCKLKIPLILNLSHDYINEVVRIDVDMCNNYLG